MFFSSIKRAAAAILLCLVTAHSSSAQDDQTVVDIISRDIRFSTLVTSLTAARLTETRNPQWASSWKSLASNGAPVTLNNNATIVEQDKVASNGIVQVLDYALLPISATQNIYRYAKANPTEFSILVELIEAGELVEALSGPGPISIFAPTNEAFQLIQDQQWYSFINDRDRVRNLLLYHVTTGNTFGADLHQVNIIETLQGSPIAVSSTGIMAGGEEIYEISLNTDTTIAVQDMLVSNGVFHMVDRVLIPPPETDPTITTLAEQAGLTVFVSAARRTGLLDTFSNPSQTLTAFASTNSGFYPEFGKWMNDFNYHGHLKAAMEYQIVENKAWSSGELTQGLVMDTLFGEEVTVVTQGAPASPIIINDQSSVTKADLIASNGALQVTDRVLVPPFQDLNVVDVIARQPAEFATLVYLMILTGLIPDLSTDGPFTIFAPTNQAFNDLRNSGSLAGGGANWRTDLDSMREILQYHVVPQVVYSEDLVNGATFTTLQGSTIRVVLDVPTVLPAPVPLTTAPVPVTTAPKPYQYDGGGRRSLAEADRQGVPQSILTIDGRARPISTDQSAFNGVVHSIDAVLLSFGDDSNNELPMAAPSDEVCIQWGDFDGLCCPADATARQNAPWYCDYFSY